MLESTKISDKQKVNYKFEFIKLYSERTLKLRSRKVTTNFFGELIFIRNLDHFS